MSEPTTPREIAANEAARQAVILAFGLAGALVVMHVQRRMLRTILPGGPTPLQQAAEREERWARITVWLWQNGMISFARMANRQAEQARRDYEAERP